MDLSSIDPYSDARPDNAKVVHIHLDLFVDFNETVLRGKVILFIEMTSGYDQIILDFYQLNEDKDKISVTDYLTGVNLEYAITKNVNSYGSKFTIQLPLKYKHDVNGYKYKYRLDTYYFHYNYKIQIECETCKGSSALYWLRSDQTSDGTYPMLITNNKISVPKDFNFVTICGVICNQIINVEDRCKHIFFETILMPSYTMIIMIASLEDIQYAPYDNVTLWAENKFIEQSKIMLVNIIQCSQCQSLSDR
ncbi:Leukotriene A-4 hydrolase [Trachymyrmex zeteki]|uniref:Leukotriene A-4 hydrolase n=1 Tax=Mycetomoellerius zeteki TaxID=64791 RepID=A0A151X7L5_9HYME|nr:Leukotriene A-4 hydrolase [Trachymyrmex zeteki]